MGQIFEACAFDIENKKCCTDYADKFQANCYSSSGPVLSMHYLLRQAPYRVMWSGDVILGGEFTDYISEKCDEVYLLGLSTYLDSGCFSSTYKKSKDTYSYKNIKFIDKNKKRWKRIDVKDEAFDYFDWEKNKSVEYSGYLINHTKKLAVDLKDFFKKSVSLSEGIEFVIDAVPFLTETGGGIETAIMNGMTVETTENLNGTWCCDLLQIVDTLPVDYKLIDCCISEIGRKAIYCYFLYGVNKDGLLLKDAQGNIFKGCKLDILTFKRGPTYYLKPTIEGKNILIEAIKANKQGAFKKSQDNLKKKNNKKDKGIYYYY